MPIPGTQEIRRPLLEAFKGETPRNFSMNETLEIIAEHYGLNLNDFSSGDKNILKSRISDAKSFLKKNNLLYNPSGNTCMITNAGTEILEDDPEIISDEYLKARRKKPLPLSETLGIETPPESQEIETTPAPEILPDNDTNDDSESDLPQENETLTDNETSQESEGDSESETLTDDDTPPEIDSHQEDIALDDEALTDDETPQESESDSEPETLTENDTPPNDEALLDDVTEIETPANDETPSEIDAQQEDIALGDEPPEETQALADDETPQDDITLGDETFTDNETSEETDEAPEEILDTEEVYTNPMPEDMYEPEETHEDLTTAEETNEPEHEEPYDDEQAETEPEEEEYNPALLAAAMHSDSIDDAIARHNSELADQLLMKAAGLPSDRFEMLVIDLLSKMGYFAFQTARYTTESSGSDMIHGVILDNQTGANIYIQARKLYPGKTIGKADIQDFIDELSDKGGKGIYATTATFSENAKVLAADERLMLIDGEKLANLMIANNFCVNVEKVYEIKAIDTESFSEYE